MKLSKISLLQLSKAEMERREQNLLRGGQTYICKCMCSSSCGCKYAGPQEGPDDSYYGGSSTEDNAAANKGHLDVSARDEAIAVGGYVEYGRYSV